MINIFQTIDSINHSKYLAGVCMIVLNLGSKYVLMEISENQEQLLANKIFRRFIIFTIAFIGTRDIISSIIITASFVILVSNIFNENSKYCVLKKNKNKKPFTQVSKNDYLKALKLIQLYELQQKD